ncbi:SDR family NAD(P)-dependent oxidoreductase [Skermania sp. ID1734]|nr:SDR family NAD(P)-dependent oxidoreductase [Skermania sp. ID1734]
MEPGLHQLVQDCERHQPDQLARFHLRIPQPNPHTRRSRLRTCPQPAVISKRIGSRSHSRNRNEGVALASKLSIPNKTVLITGAARGIGAETARQLHAKGANVTLVGLEPDHLKALATELGSRVIFFEADVTDLHALDEAATNTASRFGGIDVVIANAGIAPPTTTVADITVADFERTLDVNINGVFRTVKSTLPHILAARGHIVLISSIYAFLNGGLNASYAMSKAAVEQLGRALRVELAATGATAGVAYFGFIDTDMVSSAFTQPSAATMRKAFPAFLTEPITLDAAVSRLVRGIEHRSGRIVAPRWVASALLARGPLGLLDPQLARNKRVHEAIEIATERNRPCR